MKSRLAIYCSIPMILSILIFSCKNNNGEYYTYCGLKNSQWNLYDTLSFTVDSSLIKTPGHYAVFLQLINNAQYKYKDLWLQIDENLTSPHFKDFVLKYDLADESGTWKGSGFGSLFQASFPLINDFDYSEKKSYKIKISHRMLDHSLSGIEKVGIKIMYRNR